MSRLSRLMAILVATRGTGSLVGAVCRTALEAIEVDGAGLSLISNGHRGPVCAEGAFAITGEELQFSLGEGPCSDAFSESELIEVTNISSNQGGTRWPIFTGAMHEAGLGSLASFPLVIGAARFGALTVYRSAYGQLSSDQVADGYLVAQIAAYLIVAEQAQVDDEAVIPEIEAGFVRMGPLHQATGMIMVQLGIGPEDALARIRGAAYAANKSALEVAAGIVDETVVLSADE